MRTNLFAAGAMGVLAMALGAAQPTPARADPPPISGPVDCDRACLQDMVDQYLAAVVAHDASRLPLAPDFRYTEDGQELKVGDGFWGSASGQGVYKHYFLDPRTNQAGFYGVMKENGQNVILALRMKLEGRKISEIETILSRSGLGTAGPNGSGNLEAMGKPDAIWLQDVPQGERATREDIVRVANMYFSGLQNDDGKGDYSFFADDCYRLESGIQTTGGPHPAPPMPGAANRKGPDLSKMGCKQGFATGYFQMVTRIRDRRFPIVDEEKGVAFTFAFFDHNAQKQDFVLTDGTVLHGGLQAPFTWEVAEAFKIDKGQIKTVEAVLNNAPYGMKAGWTATDARLRRGGGSGGRRFLRLHGHQVGVAEALGVVEHADHHGRDAEQGRRRHGRLHEVHGLGELGQHQPGGAGDLGRVGDPLGDPGQGDPLDLLPVVVGQVHRHRHLGAAGHVAGLLRIGVRAEIDGQAVGDVAERHRLGKAVLADRGERQVLTPGQDVGDLGLGGGVHGVALVGCAGDQAASPPPAP